MWYPTLVEARDGTPREDSMARARSLTEFQSAFPDEASCAAFLFERRWPDGFVCPACGNARAAALRSRAYTYECSGWLQSPLLPACVVRKTARPDGAPRAVELLGYRWPGQSPKGGGDG